MLQLVGILFPHNIWKFSLYLVQNTCVSIASTSLCGVTVYADSRTGT